MKRLSLLLAPLLVLALAACDTNTTNVPSDGMIALSFQMPAATGEIVPLGVPFAPTDGRGAVARVDITVTKDGSTAKFDYDLGTDTWTYSATGDYSVITLWKDNASTTVELPAGVTGFTYSALGISDTVLVPIAYDAGGALPSTQGGVVMLDLTSILGAATLVPRLPTNVVLPGTELDLMLVVSPSGRPPLRVPYEDYTVTYDNLTNASIVGESNRGVRLDVDAMCATGAGVRAVVVGLVMSPSTPAPGTLFVPYAIDCASRGTIAADLEPPAVSFEVTGNVVSGSMGDNYAVAKLQVFDGPILLASTDAGEATGNVKQIDTFPPDPAANKYDYTFSVMLDNPAPGGLSVVAYDTSGNMFSSADAFDADNDYVRSNGSDAPGYGTRERPFRTIQHALNAVNVGGSVHLSSSFSVFTTYTVAKDGVSILGDPNTSVLVIGTWVIDASDVTLANLHITTSNAPAYDNLDLVHVQDGASASFRRMVFGGASSNVQRGIAHNAGANVEVTVTDSYFQSLTTGIFVNPGGTFTIHDDTFSSGQVGIATDRGAASITRNNFYVGPMAQLEHIGLGTPGIHVADNTFWNFPDAYIVDYTGGYDLEFIVAENAFAVDPDFGTVQRPWQPGVDFPAVLP